MEKLDLTRFSPLSLNDSERHRAYELWKELSYAVNEPAKAQAREDLQNAPERIQQAIMRVAASEIVNPGSVAHNPFVASRRQR